MSDYEKYLLQQQAERGRVYNDMTLDERLTEFIEYWHSSTERHLAIDAHLEIIKLRAENARLALLHEAAADELARVVQELREARELLADIQFRVESNYPMDSIKETARKIDDHLWDVGHRQ